MKYKVQNASCEWDSVKVSPTSDVAAIKIGLKDEHENNLNISYILQGYIIVKTNNFTL